MIKIGFTVGVWDLLHEGHINFLSQAKKYCDFLHVGIMTEKIDQQNLKILFS